MYNLIPNHNLIESLTPVSAPPINTLSGYALGHFTHFHHAEFEVIPPAGLMTRSVISNNLIHRVLKFNRPVFTSPSFNNSRIVLIQGSVLSRLPQAKLNSQDTNSIVVYPSVSDISYYYQDIYSSSYYLSQANQGLCL